MKRYKSLTEKRLQAFKAWYNPESDYLLQFSEIGLHREQALQNLHKTEDQAMASGYYRISTMPMGGGGYFIAIESNKFPNDREFAITKQMIKDNTSADYKLYYWEVDNKKYTYEFKNRSFFMSDSIKDGRLLKD